MPTPTYTPLAEITLGSAAASVTFSSISQAYRDLVLVVEGWVTSNTGQYMTLNSDTTNANYSWVRATGNGATATSGSSTADRQFTFNVNFDDNSANRAICLINMQDYSASDKHKSSLVRMNRSGQGTEMAALRWANTAAVTSIKLEAVSTTWGANTSFALYGIAA